MFRRSSHFLTSSYLSQSSAVLQNLIVTHIPLLVPFLFEISQKRFPKRSTRLLPHLHGKSLPDADSKVVDIHLRNVWIYHGFIDRDLQRRLSILTETSERNNLQERNDLLSKSNGLKGLPVGRDVDVAPGSKQGQRGSGQVTSFTLSRLLALCPSL